MHTDGPSPYSEASAQLARAAKDLKVRISMGRTGVCWDNAQIESFWSTLKHEFYNRQDFATNWFRGGTLRAYDKDTQRALEELDGHVDVELAREIWANALDARWDGVDRWFHGDIAEGNLLLNDGQLAAVITSGHAASATRPAIWPSPGRC